MLDSKRKGTAMKTFHLAKVLAATLLLTLLSGYSFGVDPLPTSMKGHWVNDSLAKRREGGGDWSVQIIKVSDGGAFEGKVSFSGQKCYGKDMPMTGTYNGSDLVIDIPKLGDCGQSTATLHKNGTDHMFEGGMSHSPGIKGYLDPQ
jgi:hypothetical protein